MTTRITLIVALLATACTQAAPDSEPTSRQANAGDWKAEAAQDADTVRKTDPDRVLAFGELQPIRTRKGTLRFVGEAVRDPAAAPLLLARLAEGESDPEVRAALIEALPRTGGDYGGALVEMLGEEEDADLRVQMIAALERADAGAATEGLRVGLTDADPAVRVEAARVAGMRADGSALQPELVDALSDEAPPVRAAAARSIGVLALEDARDALLAGVADADDEVRLESLRAVGRLDPAFARTLPALKALQSDDDARISAVAAKLAQ